jgi:hypothetical protein
VRRWAWIALVALLASCGGDDDGAGDSAGSTTAPTVVDRSNPIPPDLEAFLARVDPSLAFTATYTVLQRAGGTTAEVTVDGTTISAGDLVVQLPASTADEARLSELGIFSTFFAAGPAAQIEATARRADADEPLFDTRTVAGVELDCVRVPVTGATASQWCLTPEGVFGFVSTPSVQYELTSYALR